MPCDGTKSSTTWRPNAAASYLVIDQATGRMTTRTGDDLLHDVGVAARRGVYAIGALRHGPRYVIDTQQGLLIVEQRATAGKAASSTDHAGAGVTLETKQAEPWLGDV